jgi:hypothetical protein
METPHGTHELNRSCVIQSELILAVAKVKAPMQTKGPCILIDMTRAQAGIHVPLVHS